MNYLIIGFFLCAISVRPPVSDENIAYKKAITFVFEEINIETNPIFLDANGSCLARIGKDTTKSRLKFYQHLDVNFGIDASNSFQLPDGSWLVPNIGVIVLLDYQSNNYKKLMSLPDNDGDFRVNNCIWTMFFLKSLWPANTTYYYGGSYGAYMNRFNETKAIDTNTYLYYGWYRAEWPECRRNHRFCDYPEGHTEAILYACVLPPVMNEEGKAQETNIILNSVWGKNGLHQGQTQNFVEVLVRNENGTVTGTEFRSALKIITEGIPPEDQVSFTNVAAATWLFYHNDTGLYFEGMPYKFNFTGLYEEDY